MLRVLLVSRATPRQGSPMTASRDPSGAEMRSPNEPWPIDSPAPQRSDYEDAMNGRATDATGGWGGGGGAPRSSGGAPTLSELWGSNPNARKATPDETILYLLEQVSALRQEAAILKVQLEEALDAHTRATTVGLQLAQDVTVARQEAETLRGQLDAAQKGVRMYGQHDHSCRLYTTGDCDCGFPAALDAARVAAPREPK